MILVTEYARGHIQDQARTMDQARPHVLGSFTRRRQPVLATTIFLVLRVLDSDPGSTSGRTTTAPGRVAQLSIRQHVVASHKSVIKFELVPATWLLSQFPDLRRASSKSRS